mmetsp:Transcript_7583/g.6934  ORF Transcript_7583/g.6934 Transcript_7583/m.6934 type:complete len:114 (+) Transcript_7583:2855-3196(+)
MSIQKRNYLIEDKRSMKSHVAQKQVQKEAQKQIQPKQKAQDGKSPILMTNTVIEDEDYIPKRKLDEVQLYKRVNQKQVRKQLRKLEEYEKDSKRFRENAPNPYWVNYQLHYES